MAKVYCPNCHSEVKLPEKSTVGFGITLSQECCGEYPLPLSKVKNENINKEEENKTMNSNANNGYKEGEVFDVNIPGIGMVKMTIKNGNVVMADHSNKEATKEPDPILEEIINDGYVRNTKLHRRWVMAQMFKMLNYQSYNGKEHGYDACLRNRYGYMYQFDMMLEEVRVLSKLENRDNEAFTERSQFFTKEVVVAVCDDYLRKLELYLGERKVHKCKGIPYIYVDGKNIFISDLNKKVYSPVKASIHQMTMATNYSRLYQVLRLFRKQMITLPSTTPKSKIWIDTYKGEGATYTLLNLVKYHGCDIFTFDYVYSGKNAVDYISDKIYSYKGEYWRMMALLKKVIADNQFDFDKTMSEIYK